MPSGSKRSSGQRRHQRGLPSSSNSNRYAYLALEEDSESVSSQLSFASSHHTEEDIMANDNDARNADGGYVNNSDASSDSTAESAKKHKKRQKKNLKTTEKKKKAKSSSKTRHSPTAATPSPTGNSTELQVQELAEENAKLQANLRKLSHTSPTHKALLDEFGQTPQYLGEHFEIKDIKPLSLSKLPKAYFNSIKGIVNNSLFRTTKFCTSHEQLQRFAEKVVDKMEIDDLLPYEGCGQAELALICERRKVFITTYLKGIGKALNDKRNYVQSQMRKAVEWWLDHKRPERKGKLPSIEAFEKAITRDFKDLEPNSDLSDEVNEQNAEKLQEVHLAFDLILNLFAPCVTSPDVWTPKDARTTPISTARIDNGPPGALKYPPSSEAIIILLLKNCIVKWEKMYEFRHEEGYVEKESRYPVWTKEEPDLHTEYLGIYSDSHCGQCIFGGWKHEGHLEFNRLIALIKKGRASEFCEEVEKASMERIEITPQLKPKQRGTPGEGPKKAPAAKLKAVQVDFEEEV